MIRIRKKLVAFESISMTSINPEYHRPNKSWLKDYTSRHPFPKDNEYSEKDMIYDLAVSGGMLTLPMGVSGEVITYMEDLLNEII